VSTTLHDLPWGPAKVIGRNVAGELTRLKQQPGKNIGIVGSLTLVRSLLHDGVLDELDLMIFPILVGPGRHLFDGWAETAPLELVRSRTFSTGVLSLAYRRPGTKAA